MKLAGMKEGHQQTSKSTYQLCSNQRNDRDYKGDVREDRGTHEKTRHTTIHDRTRPFSTDKKLSEAINFLVDCTTLDLQI